MRISDWSSDVCSSDRAGLAFAQAHGKVALGGVRGVLFDFDAGRAECDHARAFDKRLRVPAGEMIERPAAEDRVDARLQAFDGLQVPAQPAHSPPRRLFEARHPYYLPAPPATAPQQRPPPRAAAATHPRATKRDVAGTR